MSTTNMEQWDTGDLVWFDPGVGHWLPGEILESHRGANVLTIQAVINGKPQTFTLAQGEGGVRRRQDLGTAGLEDMTQLSDLHEAALLWNLKLRYDRNLIYTYTGRILVAVNPYRIVDVASYGVEAAQRYRGRLMGALPPHLFAVGAGAYAALPSPQVVVISGESGSGKTESTKLVMQYLAAVAPSAPRTHALVTEQILEATPLLEAFGNARTLRNDNSSRFGKYLEVFLKGGAIVGARVTQYLLEKSRIVTQAPGERNYHVFYELLGGLPLAERQKYGLVEADKYFYLNQGGGDCGAGHSGSGADWGALTRAMQVLGVGESEQEGIVKLLAAVLHLGNVYFHRRQLRHGQEGVEVGSDVEIKWAAHLLQISAAGLQRALTTRITEARSERVHSPLSIDQALDARDAFAKALYSALFSWLVTRVNSIVQRGGLHDAARISLLDIFGFENLAENSFEQLCINYASESLQLHFARHVFKLEQQEYARERLDWTPLTWTDNTPVIQLLGKKPVGVLHLLDDESNFPRASDASFLEKCHYNHALNENYCRPRVGGREFGIRHFAGQVWYSVDGFLDKNRDVLRPEVVELLASSKESLVSAIAKPLLGQAQTRTLPRGTNGRFVTMKPRTPTVAARFSDSLQQLIESMSKCNPWFIRCIKPNNDKTPMRFDMPVVLEQLRYSGMLDTIRIRQSGYPVRLKFQQFVERYRYLLPGKPPRGAPYRDLCRAILENRLPPSPPTNAGPDYQLGATRIFLRESLERHLEVTRTDQLRDAALVVQKHIRGYLARRKFTHLKHSTVTIQKNWRRYRAQKKFHTILNGVIKAQALHRGRRERKRFVAKRAEYKRRMVEAAARVAEERVKLQQQQQQQQRVAAREQQVQAQQQRVVAAQKTTLANLEVPAELAFILSKIDGHTATHSDRNLVKVVGGINGSNTSPVNQPLVLPPDIHQFEFAKFTSVYFKGAEFGMRRDPISAPFLAKAAARDSDFQDAVAVFKLVLRWCSPDNAMTGVKERALADYIVHKGISSRGLRDELLVQLVNQSWKNENAERIWQLMSHCLSCFQPSPSLSKYLLKYISDHATPAYKEILQRKILRGIQKAPHSRTLPPSLLEWRTTKQKCNMALPLTLADNTMSTVVADSWTTCQEAAALALSPLGIPCDGWTVVLDDSGVTTDSSGLDFVFDLLSDLELSPGFPIPKTSPLIKAGVRRNSSPPREIEHHITSSGSSPSSRPQVPPPEPPMSAMTRKMSREVSRQSSPMLANSSHSSSRKTSHHDANVEYQPQAARESSPRVPATSTPAARKSSHEALSRSSALNERYFDIEKVRSRSLDNLLSEPEPAQQQQSQQQQHSVADLGLSQSRLNDRYHSVEQLAPIKPVLATTNYKPPQQQPPEIDFEYPDVSSISTSNRGGNPGGPRYIKSQYSGKKAPPGSHSSRAHIEKSTEFGGVRSSAMSDTSEAPSLASHVRRVRVPSQASDVDQFLDELFSPVLDGNLDELSDARSLAASIKGGGCKNKTVKELEKETIIKELEKVETVKELEKVETVDKLEIRSNSSFNGYLEDLLSGITQEEVLSSKPDKIVVMIRGGGSTTHQPNGNNSSNYNNFSSMPTTGSQPMMMLGSPPESYMPMYNMQGMSLPPTGEIAAYQQNLQRAFLQSAMAQNIQIQQQLLAQNQALQQLLTQSSDDPTSPTSKTASKTAEVLSATSSPPSVSPPRKTSFSKNPARKTSSPNDYKMRKSSNESSISALSRSGSGVPPPPPPMPPPLDGGDPSETRPFLDPYGRAKTVRIGKWRWPPPKDGTNVENGEDFMHFKLRQHHQRKVTPNSMVPTSTNGHNGHPSNSSMMMLVGGATSPSSGGAVEWEEMEFEAIPSPREDGNNTERNSKANSSRRSFDVGASRPSPGSVGKLKLSSEMRQRLEQVTANHSVRSTSSKVDKPARVVNKLEDTRKMMLEQQLGGRWGDSAMILDDSHGDDRNSLPSPVTPAQARGGGGNQTSASWNSSSNSWKPGPPPPPIGPNSLPPAPSSPAPPPPIRPPQNLESVVTAPQARDSYMAQRQDRDTFGVHQNRNNAVTTTNSKRNSFSANWDIQSGTTQDTTSEGINAACWGGQDLDGQSRGSWDQGDGGSSLVIDQTRVKMNPLNSDNWDVSEVGGVSKGKNSVDMSNGELVHVVGSERPTFRTHQYSKHVEKEKERVKKSSVSTQDTEKVDEWPEFMRPIKTPPVSKSPLPPQHHSPHLSHHQHHNHNLPPNIIPPASYPQQAQTSVAAAAPSSTPTSPSNNRLSSISSSVTYSRVPWMLRARKEVFTPAESLTGSNTSALNLIFAQVVADVFGVTACGRLSAGERRAGMAMLTGFGVTVENSAGGQGQGHRVNVKRNVVELARTWPLYFARMFQVSGALQLADVQYIAVSHWGIHYVRRESSTTNNPQVLRSFALGEVAACVAPRPTTVSLEVHSTQSANAQGQQPWSGRMSFQTTRAQQLSEMVTRFCMENRKLQSKVSPTRAAPVDRLENSSPVNNMTGHPSSLTMMENNNQNSNQRNGPNNINNNNSNNNGNSNQMATMQGGHHHRERSSGLHQGSHSPPPGSPPPPSGKYSLLQFAMHNFRQSSDLELLKMDSSLKSKEKRKEWTWKQQTDLVKWQAGPIEGSLLRLEDPELAPLAVECFECILRYCGDMPLTADMSEVKCVYTVLMHCHKHIMLRDEVYCQLMKQTTSNKATGGDSAQRAWRLLSIVAAYFGCSEHLGPYLTEHLSSAAADRRRTCHGTAVVCLANLRKTQRCGGRKNVPSVEEVTAVSAGRSARRQIYRLPGGAERVVNTRCSTVVADVITELCTLIGVTSDAEQNEFSLYCIVQGDAFTMPLAADEYILDVTTELHKAAQPFYLIFCRSVWYHPLRHDASALYTEVLFNQVAPDYLEGLLLRLGNPNLPPSIVRDMSLVAALLHRAADLHHSPTLKEVKFLLPKPVLGLREPRPPQWLALVQTAWGQAAGVAVARAKHRVLQVLSNWQLFGSSFFAVKRVLSGDVDQWQEHILALNRAGVHFLDMTSHETLQHWPYAEVISTRKVRSEDGSLFLDMKCGNLLQQRVTRLQTEQAHEISRLVRQYITLEQTNNSSNGNATSGGNNNNNSNGRQG